MPIAQIQSSQINAKPDPSIQNMRLATLAFYHAEDIGPRTFKDLLENYGSMDAIYEAALVRALPHKVQSAWSTAYRKVGQYVAKLKYTQLEYVCCWEPEYPSLLNQTIDPPIILMYRGDLNVVNAAGDDIVAVVGNRSMSAAAEAVTHEVCTNLTKSGQLVVSGMAFGVDKVASTAAAEVGPTVAVLASSADQPTPRSNRDLYAQILASGGLILSETWPGTPMAAGLFPMRNRIIAGMAKSTIVIEAGEKSGAIITAHQAQSYSREVFAIPWSWNHPAQGTNILIKRNLAEIYLRSEVTYQFPELKLELSAEEKIVVDRIAAGVNDIDRLTSELALSQTALLSLILDLEIRSVIWQHADGKYYINNKQNR
jgi:DNA processing protein